MAAPFVLVEQGTLAGDAAGAGVELDADARHHLKKVLRLRPGAAVTLADGAGLTAAGEWDGERVRLAAGPTTHPVPTPRVTVWQALGKGRRHEHVVRVLTELGVDRIVAVTSDHSQVKLDGRRDRAMQRWTAVARAAAAQSRRAHLPELAGPSTVTELVGCLDGRQCLLADVGAPVDPLEAAGRGADRDVVVAVGPEGGWSDDERAVFTEAGAIAVSLGPTVLRTEHAATVLSAVVLAAIGRMGG